MFTKINKTWKIIITVIAVVLTAVIVTATAWTNAHPNSNFIGVRYLGDGMFVTCIYDNDIESYETQIHSNIGSLANWIYS